MDVGAHLRSARERRGQTVEQVACATKLSPSLIRRIERNEWGSLPGGLLTRGHLRAYAVEVGLDPEDIVQEYRDQLPSEAAAAPEVRVRRNPTLDTAQPTRQAVLTIGALLLMAATWWWLARPSDVRTTVPRPAIDPPNAAAPRDEPPPAPDAMPAVRQDGPRLSLVIDLSGPCWIAARADGRPVAFRLFQAGESLTLTAEQEVVLRVGDPRSFTYTLNGLAGRPFGERGEPITVTITESNIESFLVQGQRNEDTRAAR